jgi:hypothetical protein
MTLADELMGMPIPRGQRYGRIIELGEPALRLPFDGGLSAEELRMAEQHTFDGPASWEDE